MHVVATWFSFMKRDVKSVYGEDRRSRRSCNVTVVADGNRSGIRSKTRYREHPLVMVVVPEYLSGCPRRERARERERNQKREV